MKRYMILLRGINVGGRTIKMADLKSCLEKAGFSDIKTYLQSGNVVCASGKSAKEVKELTEQVLTSTFAYPAKAIVVSQSDLEKIVTDNPFNRAPDDFHQYVIFFENGLEKDFIKDAVLGVREEAQVGKSVVYWKVPKGQTLKSTLAKTLGKAKFKTFNTNRNINTLRKMLGS